MKTEKTILDGNLFISFEYKEKVYSLLMPNDNLSECVFMEVFAYKCYPLLPLEDYKPKVVVDVGGFIGDSALYFHLFYPEAEVHVFEPAKKNLFYLSRNLKDYANIKIHPYGLAEESNDVEIFLGFGGAQNSRFMNDETTTNREKIRLKSVQEEVEKIGGHIDILKVDIEGGEVAVIEQFLKHAKNEIPMIYFEYHSEEDRLAFDQLLKEKYNLSYGDIQTQNRGTLLYVAKSFNDKAYVPYKAIVATKN
jgi:FkbM family methyltransferase